MDKRRWCLGCMKMTQDNKCPKCKREIPDRAPEHWEKDYQRTSLSGWANCVHGVSYNIECYDCLTPRRFLPEYEIIKQKELAEKETENRKRRRKPHVIFSHDDSVVFVNDVKYILSAKN